MEEILGQVMQPPTNLRKFLMKYKQMFETPYTLPCHDVDIQDVLQLGDERFKKVEDMCSLDQLSQDDEARIADFVPGFSETVRVANANFPLEIMPLKSYIQSMKHKEPRKVNPFQRAPELYRNYRLPKEPYISSPIELQPEQELKIYIRLYRPARVTHAGRTIERPVFAQEIECLASNLLTEFRDKILCICNNKHFFDVSENPEAPLPVKETDPGYFFITDTFYNDKRNPSNVDYSETIINWAKKAKGLSSLKFKTALMEKTRMIDLTVSLGFPQLYQHHGNCEHVFVFSQLEVITNLQHQLISLSKYPEVLSVNRFTSRTCNICSKVNFVFVVQGSNRLLNDPSYLCHKCFLAFHYVDGKKVGDFKAYRLNDEPLTTADNMEEINEVENNDDVSFEMTTEFNESDGDIDDINVKEETDANEE